MESGNLEWEKKRETNNEINEKKGMTEKKKTTKEEKKEKKEKKRQRESEKEKEKGEGSMLFLCNYPEKNYKHSSYCMLGSLWRKNGLICAEIVH